MDFLGLPTNIFRNFSAISSIAGHSDPYFLNKNNFPHCMVCDIFQSVLQLVLFYGIILQIQAVQFFRLCSSAIYNAKTVFFSLKMNAISIPEKINA